MPEPDQYVGWSVFPSIGQYGDAAFGVAADDELGLRFQEYLGATTDEEFIQSVTEFQAAGPLGSLQYVRLVVIYGAQPPSIFVLVGTYRFVDPSIVTTVD